MGNMGSGLSLVAQKTISHTAAVSRRAAHAWLRYGLRIMASSRGGSEQVAQAAGSATKAKHAPPFLRRKDWEPPS